MATHLVNTTLLSLKIGHQLGLRRSELMTLATGAIFHDLPKIGLKEATLNSLEHPERAGPKDRAKVAKHWLKTLNKVFMSTALSEDAMARLVVMLESQLEFSMLSLYSAAKREKGQAALSLLGRIISVCDDFDTLTWERSGKKPLAPHPAMMKLLEGGTKRHGLPMLKIFMETFGIYPTGSLVHLDSGEVAMVLDQNRSAPARPFVRVVLDANDEAVRGPALDLLENRDLNILWYADNDKIGANLAGCLKDD